MDARSRDLSIMDGLVNGWKKDGWTGEGKDGYQMYLQMSWWENVQMINVRRRGLDQWMNEWRGA